MLDLIIIGAGPAGITAAYEAKKQNLDYLVIEKGLIGHTVYNYPVGLTVFSTVNELEIEPGGLDPARKKPTREELLSYYVRFVLDNELNVRTEETVEAVERRSSSVSSVAGSSPVDEGSLRKTGGTTENTRDIVEAVERIPSSVHSVSSVVSSSPADEGSPRQTEGTTENTQDIVEAVERIPSSVSSVVSSSPADEGSLRQTDGTTENTENTENGTTEDTERKERAEITEANDNTKGSELAENFGSFIVRTTKGEFIAHNVLFAIGAMDFPRTLGVPGEDLPKVYDHFRETYPWVRKRALIVGGGNSAGEAALFLAEAGADTTLAIFRSDWENVDPKQGCIKYWVKQPLEKELKKRCLKLFFLGKVLEVTDDSVILENEEGGREVLPNDVVFVLIGSDADLTMLKSLGVETVTGGKHGEVPVYDETTFETNVPGVYVAGHFTLQRHIKGAIDAAKALVPGIAAKMKGRPAGK
jgi:thioredoxin reductase (NADPH)